MEEPDSEILGDLGEPGTGLDGSGGGRRSQEDQRARDRSEPGRPQRESQKFLGSNPGGLTMLALDPTTRISSSPCRVAIFGDESVAVR